MARLQFSRFLGVWTTPSLPLFPGPLWLGIVVPVKASSLGQIDPFKNYLYLIELSVKTKHQKKNKKKLLNYTKNVNMNIQWIWFPNL